MGDYAGSNTWLENVYQFETTDLLQGGPTGIDNKPIKDLADRTKYLYERVGLVSKLAGELTVTTNTTLDNTIVGKLISGVKSTGGVLDITLPLSSTLPANTIIPILAIESGGVINIKPSGGNTINSEAVMHMHNNESLMLLAITGGYKIIDFAGNFFVVGEEIKGRSVVGNTLALTGQLVDRAIRPRLWTYAQSLGSFQLITDTTWNASINNKGFFSTGNGTTTFRLPDERNLFDRMTDGVRQIGSYQADATGPITSGMQIRLERDPSDPLTHVVSLPVTEDVEIGAGSGLIDIGFVSGYPSAAPIISFDSGLETRPKNISKLNLIKY